MNFEGRKRRRVRRCYVIGGGEQHEDRGLLDLPEEILEKIMLFMTEDLKAHYNSISVISTLRRVAADGSFFRAVDLYTVQYSWITGYGYRDFFLRCHHAGNISALFIHGCSQFSHKHDLDNGIAMIREAALSGYELAIYFYCNLIRLFSPDLEIDLELVNPSRNLIKRMRRKVETNPHCYWEPNPWPQDYKDRCEAFDSRIIRICQCACNDRWVYDWMESAKDPWMCDKCFNTIHVLGFIRLIPNSMDRWPLNYEF